MDVADAVAGEPDAGDVPDAHDACGTHGAAHDVLNAGACAVPDVLAG